MSSDGLLNLHKPPGMTSFAVVAQVRRLTRVRRVGHAGTLDPDASGVLPIGIGQGTRVFEYFASFTKVYRAELVLGIDTDTYDASGAVTAQYDASHITRDMVKEALGRFIGDIQQRPPMYSALKRDGQRLYELARRGEVIDLAPRPVRILRLELRDWQPPAFTLEVECGRGTYIRSLAHDLGQALGCGAHMRTLVRTKDGPFTLDEAISLEDFAQAVGAGTWQDLLLPLDYGLPAWRSVALDPERVRMVQNGRPLVLGQSDQDDGAAEGEPCRVYAAASGEFIGVLRHDATAGVWRPIKVFRTDARESP